ncbi:hypothetical protein ACTJJ4_11830 [Microbacterium sp. 22195]|uniref:hypothetical protein n=1 Tax=Microbacterium sp. 22195 TaxID=3453891 RepID=UPI003F8528AF
MGTEQDYQAFVKAAIMLATAVDVADQIANNPTFLADRSPRANRLREIRHAEDLIEFREAYAQWVGKDGLA